MKKRMVTLAMAGIMATAMMGTTAMAATQVDTASATVDYIADGYVSQDGSTMYYLTFPSNLHLSASKTSDTHSISISAADGYNLDGLAVKVEAQNAGKLLDTQSNEVQYTLTYGGKAVNGSKVEIATLGGDPNGTTVSGTASITNDDAAQSVAKGTKFSDTITFTFTEQ